MLSDRELLELAAKAAGYPIEWHGEIFIETNNGPRQWNPLTDDGDALRLAVLLKLNIFNINNHVSITTPNNQVFVVDLGIEREEATRRAIVFAAAKSGRSM